MEDVKGRPQVVEISTRKASGVRSWKGYRQHCETRKEKGVYYWSKTATAHSWCLY